MAPENPSPVNQPANSNSARETITHSGDVYLDELFNTLKTEPPVDTKTHILLKLGTVLLLSSDIQPIGNIRTPYHRESHKNLLIHFSVIIFHRIDQTGQSEIWTRPLKSENGLLYATPTGITAIIHRRENPTQGETEYQEILKFLDIAALERMGINTTGVTRFIDQSQKLVNLSEFVAKQFRS
jgi:hypothetical protein